MRRYCYILYMLVAIFSTQVAKSQAIIDMPISQNPVFEVSAESVFLNFTGAGMTIGADLVVKGGSGTYAYEWSKGGDVLGKDETLHISEPGIYKLKIEDTCDCVLTVTFTVASAGVDDLKTAGFSVYPNPASDFIKVKSKNGMKIMQVALVSVSGKVVALYPDIYGDSLQIAADGFADGEYLLTCVYSDKSVDTVKILIKK